VIDDGDLMATRRTSFDKLQRERAKRAKAASKRERRQERAAGGDENDPVLDIPVDESLSAGELMQRLEVLHSRFEANSIDFDTFEEQKRELLERLAALPLD
jgi:hypothetical protein